MNALNFGPYLAMVVLPKPIELEDVIRTSNLAIEGSVAEAQIKFCGVLVCAVEKLKPKRVGYSWPCWPLVRSLRSFQDKILLHAWVHRFKI